MLAGALLGLYVNIPRRLSGLVMSFGTGVLIGAASFELLVESVAEGGMLAASLGFLSGALLYTSAELVITKKGGHERKRSVTNPVSHSGLSILIGTLIDAVPESLIIGVSLLNHGHISYLVVVAVFISNFPEGLSSSIGLKKDGYSSRKILIMWTGILLLSAVSSLAGYSLLHDSTPIALAFIASFAAGGIIAMVSATMMPEAFEEGGAIVGLVSSLGLLCSLLLTSL
nr:ZIP family metal transporter [Metabacillus lacus]